MNVNAAPMRRALGDMRKRLNDLGPVMEGRATAFERMTAVEVFGQSQSPLGVAWKKNQPRTTARKLKKGRTGGPPMILIDRGKLVEATHAVGTKKGIRVGVSGAPATYGTAHQFGKGVPRRPFLPLNTAGQVTLISGPAKTWATRAQKRIRDWVLKGTLS